MIQSLEKEALASYVTKQLGFFFPDGLPCEGIMEHMSEVLERVEICFSGIHEKYFRKDSRTFFNHLNSNHYGMFLYFLSNTLFRRGADISLCEKIFYLNKVLHGGDLFYSIELPDIFMLNHAVGTVLGKAVYSNYFLVHQNCTIGGNPKLEYPLLGEHVAVYRGAAVIGKCRVGDNCAIAADSLLLDQDLPSNTIYIGSPRDHIMRENRAHARIWGPGN